MSPISRREFLKTGSLYAATPFISSVASSPENFSPPCYIDGLCTNPYSPETIKDSGLCAFMLDITKAEEVKENDTVRFVRSFDSCAKSIASHRLKLREISDSAFLATRGEDIDKARAEDRTAVFFQMQSCEPLEGDLEKLDVFYELGLRILQITHHHNNPFGGGALEIEPVGLSALGFQAIEVMNELHILPDVAHASDKTALDVVKHSATPVILSHGAARVIVDSPRCSPDEVIRAIADSGGVMGIFMMSFWLTDAPEPSIEHLIHQINHVIAVGGLDSVGIGNDFTLAGEMTLAELGNDNAEGVKRYYPWWESMKRKGLDGFDVLPKHVVIPELNNVRRMFMIREALEVHGFKTSEIEGILGLNWARVLRETLG